MIKLNFRFLQRLPAREKKITLSTLITIIRIVLTPFVVYAMLIHYWTAAAVLFTSAALTDMLDGNIARWRQEQTFLGACLDPIADKILILSSFCTLAYMQSPLLPVSWSLCAVLLVKEFVLIGGALMIYCLKGHIEIHPLLLGKLSTLVQMAFIIWLFVRYFFGWNVPTIYASWVGLIVVLVIASCVQYSYRGIRWLYEVL